MEKYSQFRDRGSGIAPFFPVPSQPAGVALPFHVFIFVVRILLLVPFSLLYFLLLSWLPIGVLGKKAALWVILGAPGVWWIDLAVDGVKKGSLGQNKHRLPHCRSVIAASHTSPLDALYLGAVFDPIFVQSYPGHRKVVRITLLQAMINALLPPATAPPKGAKLVDIADLLDHRPDRCIAVFPETTTTNGRGILPFSPSLLTVPPRIDIFPISLRYTPADVTTPVPGRYFSFMWNLCSKPTHCIRVRIAEPIWNDAKDAPPVAPRRNSYETNLLDNLHKPPAALTGRDDDTNATLNDAEKKVLDKVAEALARLGRIKRVGLGVDTKLDFIKLWAKRR